MTTEELEREVVALREFTLKHVGALRQRVFPEVASDPLADGLGAMRSIYTRTPEAARASEPLDDDGKAEMRSIYTHHSSPKARGGKR